MSAQLIDIEKIIAPLSTTNPCGESARYEPEYEALQAEIAKQESLNPEPVNWGQVIDDAKSILEAKSKDLLVASYLCYGLFERQGYEGLASGVQILLKFIQQFWEDLYPEKKRLRGRVAAASWLVDKLEKGFEQRKPGVADKDRLSEIQENFEQIRKAFDEHAGNDSPDFTPVLRGLKEFVRDIEDKSKPEAPKPAVTAVQSSSQVTTEQEATKALRQCQQVIRNVSAFLRDSKLEDPRPYRLIRLGTWLIVDQVPQNQNGITPLAAVPAELVQKYEKYLSESNYTALISEVEESFSKSPFWLDAHRYAAMALDALGAKYTNAKKTVTDELAQFINRLPGIVDLKFSNGTAFANEQTKLWIESEVSLGSDSQNSNMALGGGGADSNAWMDSFKEAKKLAAKGKMQEAMKLFSDGQQTSGSQREKFFWRLYQARFCYDAGLINVAIPQLEDLDRLSERYSLEDWEPQLSLEVARILLMCYAKSIEKDKKLATVLSEKFEGLYARICRIDINAALAMDIKPAS